MRRAFVHEATLQLASGADSGAPGAAVTQELCGSWQHEGACRWPHHTAATHRPDSTLSVRTVFVATPEEEAVIRARIGKALAGATSGPPDRPSWSMLSEGRADLRVDEIALGERLART